MLVGMGLYAKEAHAMVETWRDSWFEEGTRIFYMVPRAQVDAALPLSIDPAPSRIARVFVGRIELLSPWMEANLTRALTAGDIPEVKKYGRFLSPFLQQIQRKSGAPVEAPLAKDFMNSLYSHQEQQLAKPETCGSDGPAQ